MSEKQELIFALDIGTRSVIGVVGCAEKNGLRVLAIERQDHETRAMVDGQIQNINLVAQVAAAVRERLEQKVGQPLREVCVAAAGRSLKTQAAEYEMTLPSGQLIDGEVIAKLETEAINCAEQQFESAEDGDNRLYYLVGYSVTGYELDHYPMSSLLDHRGGQIKVSVIATFLPSEVVESLCMAMNKAGMEVASLTLEPIAAMNLIIPPQLRLLNLALVDIGAGTSDIAISSSGSVVGYTMATIAGDEITEAIMKQYLLDFGTAEQIKLAMHDQQPITFTDILGLEHTVTVEELEQVTDQAAHALSHEICEGVRALNKTAPSAIFLVGGGSQLGQLKQYVSEELEMEPSRVAVGSSNAGTMVRTEDDAYDLKSPDLATPLGIALSAAQHMTSGGLHITVNGRRANLFRSDQLNIRDVLMMNGYHYRDFIGRSGRNLSFEVDGHRKVIRGGQSQPAELTRNGEEASLSDRVRAGDDLRFVPAQSGRDATACVRDVVPGLSAQTIYLDGQEIPVGLRAQRNDAWASADDPVENGDEIITIRIATLEDLIGVYDLTLPIWRNGEKCLCDAPLAEGDHIETKAPEGYEEEAADPVEQQPTDVPAELEQAQAPEQQNEGLHIWLNGKPLTLQLDAQHSVYRLLDLLQYTGIDFDNLQNEVCLEINGQSAPFQQALAMGDQVKIYEKPREAGLIEHE